MTIICDTRQKKGKHTFKELQMLNMGYELKARKLDCGDYMLENGSITIDTKQDCEELYADLINQHARFAREIRRAEEQGLKLIILVEDSSVKSIADIKRWRSKRGNANGTVLYDKMKKLQYAYGVDFMFCDKEETGRMIVDILTGRIQSYTSSFKVSNII